MNSPESLVGMIRTEALEGKAPECIDHMTTSELAEFSQQEAELRSEPTVPAEQPDSRQPDTPPTKPWVLKPRALFYEDSETGSTRMRFV